MRGCSFVPCWCMGSSRSGSHSLQDWPRSCRKHRKHKLAVESHDKIELYIYIYISVDMGAPVAPLIAGKWAHGFIVYYLGPIESFRVDPFTCSLGGKKVHLILWYFESPVRNS